MKTKSLAILVAGCLLGVSAFASANFKIEANPYKNPRKAFSYVYNLCNKQNIGGGWETYMLGSYYQKGYGTNKNLIKAYVWYKASTVQKYKPAFPAFAALKKEMTSDQLSKAKKAYIAERNKSVAEELKSLKNLNQP